jgi:hypothetical protein
VKYTVITEEEAELMFDEYLDDSQEPIKVAGLTFYPSGILSKCDPIAYDLYLDDFIDNLMESDIYVYGVTDDQKPSYEAEWVNGMDEDAE